MTMNARSRRVMIMGHVCNDVLYSALSVYDPTMIFVAQVSDDLLSALEGYTHPVPDDFGDEIGDTVLAFGLDCDTKPMMDYGLVVHVITPGCAGCVNFSEGKMECWKYGEVPKDVIDKGCSERDPIMPS